MLHNRKGQIRIIEAMITCLILISGLTAAIYFSSIYAVTESADLEKAGLNILHVLDNSEVLEKIINRQGTWESELKLLIENLLPSDTFYNLTLRSALDGEVISEITDLPEQNPSLSCDSFSTKTIITVSLPLGKTEYIPLDVMLVMDVSGSMNDRLPGDRDTKLDAAKEAANMFIDNLNMTRDRVGISSFSTTATLKSPLINNFAEAKSKINGLKAEGYTNIGDGICKANLEFDAHGRQEDTLWVIILLSDGKANRPPDKDPREYALNQAENSSTMDIRIYTVGLGAKSDIDESLLEEIAGNGGRYYYAPSASDLTDIYTTIAQDLMFAVEYDVIIIELTIMKAR